MDKVISNAPPISLINSNASPKVKIIEEKRVKVHSLACNTLGVEGHAEALRWGLR
jgi:hypothetical protein